MKNTRKENKRIAKSFYRIGFMLLFICIFAFLSSFAFNKDTGLFDSDFPLKLLHSFTLWSLLFLSLISLAVGSMIENVLSEIKPPRKNSHKREPLKILQKISAYCALIGTVVIAGLPIWTNLWFSSNTPISNQITITLQITLYSYLAALIFLVCAYAFKRKAKPFKTN